MADVIREHPSRDTVIVNDSDERRGLSAGAVVALIIIGLILLFLLIGRPFGGGSGRGGEGGNGGETNINVQPPSSGQGGQ